MFIARKAKLWPDDEKGETFARELQKEFASLSISLEEKSLFGLRRAKVWQLLRARVVAPAAALRCRANHIASELRPAKGAATN